MLLLFYAKPAPYLWALVSPSRKQVSGSWKTLSVLVIYLLLFGSKSFLLLCTPFPRGGGCFQQWLLAGLPQYSPSVSSSSNTFEINPYLKSPLSEIPQLGSDPDSGPTVFRKPPSVSPRPYLQLLELAVDSGQVPTRVHILQLAFHVKELLVQLSEALHQLVGFAGLKELPRLGLGGALQLRPALPDLTQLLPHRGCQLWFLLHQLLALLPQTMGGRK